MTDLVLALFRTTVSAHFNHHAVSLPFLRAVPGARCWLEIVFKFQAPGHSDSCPIREEGGASTGVSSVLLLPSVRKRSVRPPGGPVCVYDTKRTCGNIPYIRSTDTVCTRYVGSQAVPGCGIQTYVPVSCRKRWSAAGDMTRRMHVGGQSGAADSKWTYVNGCPAGRRKHGVTVSRATREKPRQCTYLALPDLRICHARPRRPCLAALSKPSG